MSKGKYRSVSLHFFDFVIQNERAKMKKLIGRLVLVAVTVSVSLVLAGCIESSAENNAKDAAQTLKGMVSDPNSFTIHGDIVVLDHAYEDGSEILVVAIDYSGENDWGRVVYDTAVFADGDYLGSCGDSDSMALASASLLLLTCDSNEYTFVDGEKIARKIGVNYRE